jgi:hypothetical protein
MKLFKCQACGQLLYFENTKCEKCGRRLGYIANAETLSALEPEGDNVWRARAVKGKLYRFCANADFDACNWMVEAGGSDTFCVACRHNRTIPDTSVESNVVAWRRIELAKHSLFYSLLKLKLPLDGRADRDEGQRERLTFDFLASPAMPGAQTIMTGHNSGLITLALEEADDAERENRRTAMHEPYRTLLGHFRHEVGHYYWDVLVRDGGQLEAFRTVFGDERLDYGAALKQYYAAESVPANWQDNFVSAYATAHPWEDFAETWAHYLHIVDALEMARAFGLNVDPPLDREGQMEAEVDFQPYRAPDIVTLVDTWIRLSQALNALNRAMGLADFYPFILSPAVIEKLDAIHSLIHGGGIPVAPAVEKSP